MVTRHQVLKAENWVFKIESERSLRSVSQQTLGSTNWAARDSLCSCYWLLIKSICRFRRLLSCPHAIGEEHCSLMQRKISVRCRILWLAIDACLATNLFPILTSSFPCLFSTFPSHDLRVVALSTEFCRFLLANHLVTASLFLSWQEAVSFSRLRRMSTGSKPQ